MARRAAENRRRKQEERKKAKRRKKDEEEGKIVEENENSNYNKKSGRVKKEYIHPVRTIKIKIDYKDQYSQQEKLKQWFGTCRFVYNKCVSWCCLTSRQLTKDELRNKIYDHDFACILSMVYTDDFWSKWDKDGEEAAFAMKKNRYAVPYDVWDSVICDFDKAYRAHLAKVEKNKQEGKEDDPSNKCKFKFRSKKDPVTII